MEKRELTCIRCPLGCQLTVMISGGGVAVTGNTCPRGAEYGEKEVTFPTRTVTSSIRVEGGELPLVSVKTAEEVPKDRIFDVMRVIKAAKVSAPVKTGDVLIEDAAGTGINIIATKTVVSDGTHGDLF